jgi:hypothetical protein
VKHCGGSPHFNRYFFAAPLPDAAKKSYHPRPYKS